MDTTHRFTEAWIETRWAIARRRRGRYTVDVLFPSWGRAATVEAILRGGRRVTLAAAGHRRRSVSLRDVVYFYIAGEETGYVVVPTGRQAARHRAHPATQGAVLGAATRAHAGGATRPGKALQAARACRTYRSGARHGRGCRGCAPAPPRASVASAAV